MVLAQLTPARQELTERATVSLSEIGFSLHGISPTTATRVTADLRKVRETLGDLG